MRHKKIGQELATNIATAIANKAFEHLLPPAEAAVRAIADEAYDRIDAEVDLGKLAGYGFAYKAAEGRGTSVRIVADSNNYLDLATSPRAWGFSTYRQVFVNDAGLYARALEAQGRLASLTKRINQLHRELSSQLLGKTTKQAIEAWPEAAEIITDTAGIDVECSIVKPLEALLARFIPALPAPQGESA